MPTLVCILPRARQVSPAKCEQRPGLDDVMDSRAAHTSERHASASMLARTATASSTTFTTGHVPTGILLAPSRERSPQLLCAIWRSS